jgi:hypothetical protein
VTASDPLKAANDSMLGERIRRFQTTCGPRGGCRREPLTDDPGRWTGRPDCLTVFDEYGKAVNQIPDRRPRNAVKIFPTTTP